MKCCSGKDVYWYTRDKADQDAAEAAELLAVKQREEDLMAEVPCMHWLLPGSSSDACKTCDTYSNQKVAFHRRKGGLMHRTWVTNV